MNTLSKSFAILGPIILLITAGNAQPSLNNAVFPTIGQEIITIVADTTGVGAGAVGVNQIWDYSNLVPSASQPAQTVVFIDPDSTLFAMDFPTANLVGSLSGAALTYYLKEPTRFIHLASTVDTQVVNYTDPEILLETPLNFNDNFSDTFKYIFVINPNQTLTSSGEKMLTYDAYGTLKLPAGTYSNAIRLKVEKSSQDTLTVPGGYILGEETVTEYIWYKNGISGPLLTIIFSENASVIVSPSGPPMELPVVSTKSVSYLTVRHE